MKKLPIILLLCLITASAFGQPFAPQQKPMLGLQVNWAHPLSKGLVYFGLFNEGSGTKVFDLSGNRNAGVISGATWQPGKFGSALNFVAGTNKITVPHSPSLNLDGFAGNYTIIIWARGGSQPGGYRLMEKGADPYPISFQGAAGTDLSFLIYDGVAYPSLTYTGIWDSQWHQIVTQIHNADDKLYGFVDGKLLYSTTNTTTGTTANTDVLTIGNRVDNNRDFVGDIDHIIIYNHGSSAPFTPGEIALLYREPFCMLKPSWDFMLYGAISVPTVGGQVIFINMN